MRKKGKKERTRSAMTALASSLGGFSANQRAVRKIFRLQPNSAVFFFSAWFSNSRPSPPSFLSTMARNVLSKDQFVKLIVGAGQASPSPPVGPALGSKGVKSMDFCKVSYHPPPPRALMLLDRMTGIGITN
jgi:hypothetical protein